MALEDEVDVEQREMCRLGLQWETPAGVGQYRHSHRMGWWRKEGEQQTRRGGRGTLDVVKERLGEQSKCPGRAPSLAGRESVADRPNAAPSPTRCGAGVDDWALEATFPDASRHILTSRAAAAIYFVAVLWRSHGIHYTLPGPQSHTNTVKSQRRHVRWLPPHDSQPYGPREKFHPIEASMLGRVPYNTLANYSSFSACKRDMPR